jgi:FkbM family methyltransferase
LTILSRIARRALRSSIGAWSARLDRELTISLACFPRDWIGRAIVIDGLYERDLLELLATQVFPGLCRPKAVALDVGANIGNHTVFFSRHFQHVIAFEPNPVAQHILRANILFNGCADVDVVDYGLGKRNEELFLNIPAGNLGAATFCTDQGVSKGSVKCTLKRGDDVVTELLPEGASIAFVKIDVEGFELDVIDGLAQTLNAHQPVVAFESHSSGTSHGGRAIARRLQALGIEYLYLTIDPARDWSRVPAWIARGRVRVPRLVPIRTLEDGYHRLVLASPKPL